MEKSEECQLVVPRKRNTRRRERLKIVEKWRRTGLTAAEYAEKTGINEGTLSRWGREAVPVGQAEAFVELPAVGAGSDWGAEIESKAGRVRISGSVSAAWAAALIRELSRC